ncbi:MAG TPA: peptidoglycan-binding protein [Candidatus Paceibacterota bacterium]|nr:peptidoglycan-binding protein [Candidatus Paceibacterota bacterium]
MQRKYIRFFLACCAILCAFSVAPQVRADDVPLAARLLSIPYNDSTQGGLRVTVPGFSGLRGISNDGTTVYLLDGSGNVTTLPMSALVGDPGSSISAPGTSHIVGWGVDSAPTFGSPDGRSLAYSHGCLFLSTSGDTTHLDCIDVSDWSVTQIDVPADYPLPVGHGWASETLIDFADGRVGKVSAYEATTSPLNGYDSYIRMYTVSGTGKDVTIAFSHDYYTFDSVDWNLDDHGIATDGTYLYRIEYSGANAPGGDFKSWPLQDTGAPSQSYVGLYTEPFSNMTYLSHDHTGDRYMVGNYSGNQFYITSASDPGPGPGNPLTPAFSTTTSTSDGYTVQVTNYDSSFTWSASTSAGNVSINDTGLVTVAGLSVGETATTTVTTSKSNVPDGSASIAASSIPDTTPPNISGLAASSTADGANVVWTTDEAGSTKVVYSVNTQYASSTGETDTSPRSTSHSDSLSGLLACTTYHYKVVSADAAGNVATSSARTFTTAGCSGGAIPSSTNSSDVTVSTAATSTASDDGYTLAVATPANFTATSSAVTIQIKGLSSDTVLGSVGKPSNLLSSAANVVFDVTALINNTTVLDSFNAPVTISYTYTDADVSSLDESTLKMYHYHDGVWLPLDDCSVDTAANIVTCKAPSFSIFAIFGTQNATNVKNITAQDRYPGGFTVQKQVANLFVMGKVAQADALKQQWHWLFPQNVPASISSLSMVSPLVRDLSIGMSGEDVLALQKLLNANGFALATSGPGSPGSETTYFGTLTRAALAAYQAVHNVFPALGYFGPITRAQMKATGRAGVWW